jgi:sec-independent protein translocase protein TatA
MAGIGIWQLLIILAIVLMVFGTKKLRGMGGDVGGFIRGFKDSVADAGETNKHTEAVTSRGSTGTVDHKSV